MTKIVEWIRKHPFGFIGILLFIALVIVIGYWAIWADISPPWTGFGTYDKELNGPRAKTLWDWMELLLVPIILAIAGYWFTSAQKKSDIAIAQEKQMQQTLENYLDRMKELLLDRKLGSEAEPKVKRLARTLTLNVLRELNAKRNRQVIQFLQESDLLAKQEIVDLKVANLVEADLSRADLREANLSGADLSRADLREANLREANLREASLRETNLREANLREADLREADLREADLCEAYLNRAKLRNADLYKANLSGANLVEADLCGATLYRADLYKANLIGADLSRAFLSGARNLTEEQLLSAKRLEDATMPDGRKYEEPRESQVDEEAASNDK